MLNRLSVKNVALIEKADISFTSGLNVLSGETGAGKSVVLESVNFVLGAKAEKTLIRHGETECSVTAEFDISGCAAEEILSEFGFEAEDTLIISRKFSDTGKNTVKINGNSATVSMLKKLTSALIDVHGQSEHFYLLSTANQLKLIDRFAGEDILPVKERLKTEFEQYRVLKKELSDAGGIEAQRLLRTDVLNFQINEIESAGVKENEFEELTALRENLLNREKITAALNSAKSALSEEGGVSDILSAAVRILNGISAFGKNYSDISDRLIAVYAEADDLSATIGELLDGFDELEYSPEEVEERLSLIKGLFKKYGGDFAAMNGFLEQAKAEKEKLDNFTAYAEELNGKILSAEKEIFSLYNTLRNLREKAAVRFSDNVLEELKELGMNKSSFYVKFGDAPAFEECKFVSSNGYDEVEFMFSANLGEPVKPLSEVISGGEMSRFMLAVKAQTAKYNDVSTFIFDEIDAGISGAVAKTVSEKLAKIAKSAQVIAVSHLAQIASFADNNILIVKTEGDNKTVTSVFNLDKTGKIKEITRLLSGTVTDVSAVEHAKNLISMAEKYKQTLN